MVLAPLALPQITVTRNFRRERELLQELRDRIERSSRKPEDPIHVSDMIEPRRGYWERMLPRPHNDVAIQFFSIGHAGHEYLLGQDDEGGTVVGDICYSPDKREYGDDETPIKIVVEVKITTKRRIMDDLEDLESYLKQLVAYLALDDVRDGEIRIWYIALPGGPQLVAHPVYVSARARQAYRPQLVLMAKAVRRALSTQDWTDLPLCTRNLCYRSKCLWYDECQPEGRWKPKKEEGDD